MVLTTSLNLTVQCQSSDLLPSILPHIMPIPTHLYPSLVSSLKKISKLSRERTCRFPTLQILSFPSHSNIHTFFTFTLQFLSFSIAPSGCNTCRLAVSEMLTHATTWVLQCDTHLIQSLFVAILGSMGALTSPHPIATYSFLTLFMLGIVELGSHEQPEPVFKELGSAQWRGSTSTHDNNSSSFFLSCWATHALSLSLLWTWYMEPTAHAGGWHAANQHIYQPSTTLITRDPIPLLATTFNLYTVYGN